MRVGDTALFCSCLLGERRDHVTAANSEGECVYCNHHVVRRTVTEGDIRARKRHKEELHKAKKAALDLAIASWRYNEKVN